MPLYFAYGSNMDRDGMRRRCPDARTVGTATLAGWRLLVTADGYVSIVRRGGTRVHGVLWRLAPGEIAALDNYEAVAAGLYRRRVLPVRSSGRQIPAQVYIGRTAAPGRPRPGHVPLVIAAARSWNFPPGYLAALQRLAGAARTAARAADIGARR